MISFREQILPAGTPLVGANPAGTKVWGYASDTYNAVTGLPIGYFANSPSASFLATTGIPRRVTWVNRITEPQFLPVDPTLMWANPNNMPVGMNALPPPYPLFPPGFDGTVTATNPNGYNAQAPVPLVPHLHGAEVQSFSDGGPDAWWTYNGIVGPKYSTNGALSTTAPTVGGFAAAVYDYPNAQNPTTSWYHDHALRHDTTKRNVRTSRILRAKRPSCNHTDNYTHSRRIKL